MLDDTEICEEVVALVERMENFPDEFSNAKNMITRWGSVLRNEGYTKAEKALIDNTIALICRDAMKKDIIKGLMGGTIYEQSQNTIYQNLVGSAAVRATTVTPNAQTLELMKICADSIGIKTQGIK